MKVLVVGDDKSNRELLETYVGNLGHEAITALNAEKALELWQNEHPEIVITDWNMPDMNGLQLCNEIRQASSERYTYLIITSTRDASRDVVTGLQSGADDYLTKPVGRDELEVRVNIASRIIALHSELANKAAVIEDNLFQTIHMFGNLIETFDESLGGHCRRVGALSVEIAKLHPGVVPEKVKIAETAGLLHDIGMVGLPGNLLLKKSVEMDKDEKRLYLTHPEQGEMILDEIEMLGHVAVLLRGHHEQYNGRGFPDSLRGEEIPLLARIVAGADNYDNLTHRDGVDLELLPEQLDLKRGYQLDPQIVDILFEVNAAHIREEARKAYRAVDISDLKRGMVIAKNVRRKNGVLVMPAPMTLDAHKVEKLQKFHQMDFISGEVFIIEHHNHRQPSIS